MLCGRPVVQPDVEATRGGCDEELSDAEKKRREEGKIRRRKAAKAAKQAVQSQATNVAEDIKRRLLAALKARVQLDRESMECSRLNQDIRELEAQLYAIDGREL